MGAFLTYVANRYTAFTVAFLDMLIDQAPEGGLSHEILEKMNELYAFNDSKNSEIRFDWYMLGIKSGYKQVMKLFSLEQPVLWVARNLSFPLSCLTTVFLTPERPATFCLLQNCCLLLPILNIIGLAVGCCIPWGARPYEVHSVRYLFQFFHGVRSNILSMKPFRCLVQTLLGCFLSPFHTCIRPLYRAFNSAGEEGRAFALETFGKYRDGYHNIAKKMVCSDLKIE